VQRAHVGRSKGSEASGSSALLLGLEDEPGDLAGGAMHAGDRQIPTPDRRARLHVGEVEEVLPAEEVLADVGGPALHFRFPGGVARDSGIDDEAVVLRVLEEDARDRGRLAIGAARTGGTHSGFDAGRQVTEIFGETVGGIILRIRPSRDGK
jgi:hypothetical protein